MAECKNSYQDKTNLRTGCIINKLLKKILLKNPYRDLMKNIVEMKPDSLSLALELLLFQCNFYFFLYFFLE